MKKILLLLLLFAGSAYAQIVNIPDPAFKAALLAVSPSNIYANAYGLDFEPMNTIDANGNGEIEQTEADAVYSLILFDQGVNSLVGIQSFHNLHSLRCDIGNITTVDLSGMQYLRLLTLNSNQLSSLDITMLPAIEWLECGNNHLTSLDLSNQTNLTGLQCSDNLIASLNVTMHPNLIQLYCRSNLLSELDISASAALETFDCGFNNIPSVDFSNCLNLSYVSTTSNPFTAIDVSMLANLGELHCASNNLSVLDVSALTNLHLLEATGNNLTTLDCSHNTHLMDLYCYQNQLETLYIKNGSIENNIDFGHVFMNNPLQFICADDAQITTIQATLNAMSNTTIAVGSYCSFTPGGDFNTITGTLLYDVDNNGCAVGDFPPFNLNINIDDQANTGISNVNGSGNYAFYTGVGSFTITPQLENPAYFTVSPASATTTFSAMNSPTFTQDFCVTANGVHPDLEIVIVPLGFPRPGFTSAYKIIYKNKGTETLAGQVLFSYNENLMEYLDSTILPDNFVPGTIGYLFTDFPPFGVAEIEVTLGVNTPTDTPPVNNGDTLTLTASVIPSPSVDETPLDNGFTLTQEVVGSFDPNNKICLEGEFASPSDIGKYLHYNINFENTGTADAENIVVKDVIDATKFDINTLQIVESSHPLYLRIAGDTAEFIFEGINLSPSTGRSVIGGHGNVLFKIKTLPTLNVGDMVTNQAGIFFDYNFPIETNEARTTFAALSNTVFEHDNSIGVYPNPAKDWVHVKADTAIKTIEMFDVQGRILQHTTESKPTADIDISARAKGIYFLRIATEKGSEVRKLVIE